MLFRSTLGILNQAIKKKYLFTVVPYSTKSIELIKLLYDLGYINTYSISSQRIIIYFKIYNNSIVLNKLYFHSRPGHIKSVTYKQLVNLKKNKNKFYILLNNLGICTSDTSVLHKKGGIIIAEIL